MAIIFMSNLTQEMAERFGMVVDRFGIPWLINCEGSDRPPEA